MPESISREYYERIGHNVAEFLHEMRNVFPEVAGCGVGVPLEDLGPQNAGEITEEEIMKKLSFMIFLREEMPEAKRDKVLLHIARRFFRFSYTGDIVPLLQ